MPLRAGACQRLSSSGGRAAGLESISAVTIFVMGLVNKLSLQLLRDGRGQRPQRFANAVGWRVAYGNVERLREECLWRDERFAVINGRRGTCRGGRFIAVGDAWLTNRVELLAELDQLQMRAGNATRRSAKETESEPTDLDIIA